MAIAIIYEDNMAISIITAVISAFVFITINFSFLISISKKLSNYDSCL